MDTDQELVRRVKQGDRAAFDLLFTRYQHKVLALISRHLLDQDEVEDVAQETFVKAFRALPRFRGDSAFYTWLYRIAINTAKNHIATKNRRPPSVDIDVEEAQFADGADLLREGENPEQVSARKNNQPIRLALPVLVSPATSACPC